MLSNFVFFFFKLANLLTIFEPVGRICIYKKKKTNKNQMNVHAKLNKQNVNKVSVKRISEWRKTAIMSLKILSKFKKKEFSVSV